MHRYYYYRLRQIDFDNGYEYSPVISVMLERPGTVSIFPTVTRNAVRIILPENYSFPATAILFNLQGALVQQQTFPAGSTGEFDLSGIPAGPYLVHIRSGRNLTPARILKLD